MRKNIIVLAVFIALLVSIFTMPAMAAEHETFTRDDYTYEYMRDGSLKLLECSNKDEMGEIHIPDQIDGHHVESIAEYAFDGCKMSKVTIPETVKVLYSFAFNNCVNIKKIDIPLSVFYVDGNPFTGCSQLVNISVDPDHETLGTKDGVLYSKLNKALLCYPCSKTNLTYEISSGTLKIGKCAFYGCNALTKIILPSTVREIDAKAFSGCEFLKSITLPQSVLSIGEQAFAGCIMLESINIPKQISRIEKSTFFNCESLQAAYLPENLTVICDRAFYNCKKLSKIILHENVNTVGNESFYGCASLENAYVPIALTYIGDGAFDNCSPRLNLHTTRNTFTVIYARIYGISFTYDEEFLND